MIDFFVDWFLPTIAALFFVLILVFVGIVIKARMTMPYCTDQQLHQVIEQVEACKNENVICSEKMKNEIIERECR